MKTIVRYRRWTIARYTGEFGAFYPRRVWKNVFTYPDEKTARWAYYLLQRDLRRGGVRLYDPAGRLVLYHAVYHKHGADNALQSA